MATNKHAVIRYQTLDKCFRNPGRKYFIEDLVEACSHSITEFTGNEIGIKRRQVLEDIKFMESDQGWSIPLERIRDGHRVYFRYEDKNFSINNQPLNENEEKQLKEVLLTLSRFKGMPQFEWIEEISARLDAGLGLSHNGTKIIEFDQNSYLTGLEFITPIYNSIVYQKSVNIEYRSFKQNALQVIVFHPYFLKQYNNRWFVFGINDANKLLLNLSLDRIIGIKESKKKYLPNRTVDFNEYFEDIVGVSLNNRVSIENVVLKVSQELWPYIRTKPIHGSQKLHSQNRLYAVITLDLIPNYELESIIMSYGEGVEVISPKSLREKIKDRLQATASKYLSKSANRVHN